MKLEMPNPRRKSRDLPQYLFRFLKEVHHAAKLIPHMKSEAKKKDMVKATIVQIRAVVIYSKTLLLPVQKTRR